MAHHPLKMRVPIEAPVEWMATVDVLRITL